MGSFSSSSTKGFIRKQWSKPILKFFHEELKSKLIYMGLPSPNAEDILEWIEYLNKVIAFQCREYPKPSKEDQSKEAVNQLESILLMLESQNKLSTFALYDGYLEEVILNGKDNSNNYFNQDETVIIYNLDFCNQITSPLDYIDENGEWKQAYKFQVIKRLLGIQNSIESSQKFVLFLTIQSGYIDNHLTEFIQNSDEGIQKILKNYNNLKGINKKSRVLRVFVIETLRKFFQLFDYVPQFLPTIQYTGTNNFNLLHFTVFGTKTSRVSADGQALWNQKLKDLCKQKFVTVHDDLFSSIGVNSLKEGEVSMDPVRSFLNSKTYKEIWIKMSQ